MRAFASSTSGTGTILVLLLSMNAVCTYKSALLLRLRAPPSSVDAMRTPGTEQHRARGDGRRVPRRWHRSDHKGRVVDVPLQCARSVLEQEGLVDTGRVTAGDADDWQHSIDSDVGGVVGGHWHGGD